MISCETVETSDTGRDLGSTCSAEHKTCKPALQTSCTMLFHPFHLRCVLLYQQDWVESGQLPQRLQESGRPAAVAPGKDSAVASDASSETAAPAAPRGGRLMPRCAVADFCPAQRHTRLRKVCARSSNEPSCLPRRSGLMPWQLLPAGITSLPPPPEASFTLCAVQRIFAQHDVAFVQSVDPAVRIMSTSTIAYGSTDNNGLLVHRRAGQEGAQHPWGYLAGAFGEVRLPCTLSACFILSLAVVVAAASLDPEHV